MLRTTCLTPLAAAMIVCAAAQPAAAHRAPTPLALWGGFHRAGAFCQRIIGRAAARCGTAVWKARSACLGAVANGGTCDQAQVDATVQQAHQQALDIVDRFCADDAVELGFTLTLEAETDIDTFCQQLETALVSSVYRPALVGGSAQIVGGDAAACLQSTAEVATHLVRIAFRARTRALDRIASTGLVPSQKLRIIAASTALIEHARTVLQERLHQVCPEDQFTALYEHDSTHMLALVVQRADCLGGAAYVQGQVLCPAAVCGNGMAEPGEPCDDGNTVSGDGCNAVCHLEAVP